MTAPAGKPSPSDWIRAYAQVQIVTDAEIIKVLSDAQRTIDTKMNRILATARGTVSEGIRYEQLALIRRSVLQEQSAALRRIGKVVEARRLEAAARAIQIGDRLDAYTLDRLGQTVRARELIASQGLHRGLARTTQVALARMEYSYTALAQRIYNTDVWLGSRIDQKINAALARGLTAHEFASEAKDWFNPNTPGGVRYASMRLARSEINNAYHAVAVQQVQDKPWVTAMKWNLSSSHPKPDTCDEYAHVDHSRMGEGVFPKADVPRKPHPHCYCYVVPVEVDENQFLDQLTSGRYDDYLARRRERENGVEPVIPPVKPTRPVTKRAARKSSGEQVTDVAQTPFGDRVKAPGKKRLRTLGDSEEATVEKYQLSDGSLAVKRTMKAGAKREAEEGAHAEVLGSKLAKNLKLRAPEAEKEHESVWLEFLNGLVWEDEFPPQLTLEQLKRLEGSKEGHRAGVFDFIIGNTTRSEGNFLVSEDGHLQLFDHSMAFRYTTPNQDKQGMIDASFRSEFARTLGIQQNVEDPATHRFSTVYVSTDLISQEDLDHVSIVLDAMEADFLAVGKEEWIAAARDRITFLRGYATGTEVLWS